MRGCGIMQKITLVNCDVFEWVNSYDGPKFHAMLTDPPYFLDTIRKRFSRVTDDTRGSVADAVRNRSTSFGRLTSGFLNTDWDTDIAFNPDSWKVFRDLLLPGALCFSYSHARTYHRIATAIEDAGFTIYPMIGYIYSQGFPHPTKYKNGIYYNRNALKGAIEPIVVFQNQYNTKSMRDIISKYGTGIWRIDDSRIAGEPYKINKLEKWSGFGNVRRPNYKSIRSSGRWPANVIISSEYVLPFDQFFYQAKPSRSEKDAGLDERNPHPTVKPIDLNRYLSRMVLPEDHHAPRRILVPYGGTGSEAIGAMLAGWDEVVMIEMDKNYIDIAEKRIEFWRKKLDD